MSEFKILPAWVPSHMPWHDEDRRAAGISEREDRLSTRKMVYSSRKFYGDKVPKVPRHVYFLAAAGTDLIKIGSAFDIELRLEQLQTLSPVKLRLLFYVLQGGEAMERRLHQMYRRRRSYGEWFRVDVDELRAAADGLIAEARAAAMTKASPQ